MRYTKKIKDELYQKANGQCEYCGSEISPETAMIDHIVPIKDGGTSTIDNLSIACTKCNMLKADKILGSISNPAVESAAKLWIHAYIKSPVITVIVSLLSVVIGGVSIYQSEANRQAAVEAELSKNLEFKSQLSQLDETEKSLRTLLEFVESQRLSVTQRETAIQKLESEKQKLEPLVNADKETVEALFKVQEERAQKNADKERWIGFGLGILASVIASFFMVLGKYFWVSLRKNS
ncbi:HNH endonuclease [Vibrio cholerae]|uniref:HNH endonuclease n=1 Tax=Vibrio cholerae TaxID=666 RepID=UPI003F9E44FE